MHKFSVGYGASDANDIENIHKYLMKNTTLIES